MFCGERPAGSSVHFNINQLTCFSLGNFGALNLVHGQPAIGRFPQLSPIAVLHLSQRRAEGQSVLHLHDYTPCLVRACPLMFATGQAGVPQPETQLDSKAPRQKRLSRYKVWYLQKRLAEISAQVEASILEVRRGCNSRPLALRRLASHPHLVPYVSDPCTVCRPGSSLPGSRAVSR